MEEPQKVTIDLRVMKQTAQVAGVDDLHAKTVELLRRLTDPQFVELLAQSDQCTVVYHPCGTCEPSGALVEYFCSNGDGSPDYTSCEPC